MGSLLLSPNSPGSLDSSGFWAFGYDAENRMTSACQPAVAGVCSSPTVNAAYAYDPLGRRTKKSGTGVKAGYFLSDGDDEVVDYDSQRNVLELTVPGPAIDEPVAMSFPTQNGDGTYSYTHKYFHTNHQGSVIAMSGDAGALSQGPFIYDPYGNCFKVSTPCAQVPNTVPYKFTGRRLDEETGLYYYRARCYSPTLGRFCQTDPVGYTADLNLYTYGANAPTDNTDPTGNDTWGSGCSPVLHGCGGGFGDIEAVNVTYSWNGQSGITTNLRPDIGSIGDNSSGHAMGEIPIVPVGTMPSQPQPLNTSTMLAASTPTLGQYRDWHNLKRDEKVAALQAGGYLVATEVRVKLITNKTSGYAVADYVARKPGSSAIILGEVKTGASMLSLRQFQNYGNGFVQIMSGNAGILGLEKGDIIPAVYAGEDRYPGLNGNR